MFVMAQNAQTNLSGKRLLILGCGYLGTEVAMQAMQRGVNVVAVTRNVSRGHDLKGIGVDVVVGDLTGNDWHDRVVQSPHYILVCMSSGSPDTPGYSRSYVDGMKSIASWMRTQTSDAAIYTSSTSVYARTVADITEESPLETEDERSKILLEAERIFESVNFACKSRFILRLAGIYGPGRHSLVDSLRSGRTRLDGFGQQSLNLIHRNDAAKAILTLFVSAPSVEKMILNVTDGRPASREEVVEWLAGRLGVPKPAFSGVSSSRRHRGSVSRSISSAKLSTLFGWIPDYTDYRVGYASILND
jgi:nucleoside-diphosphate-sugar epimerase